jgi:hypothetical protein
MKAEYSSSSCGTEMKHVQNCTPLFCNENNEDFKIGTYNGVSIIYREKDKYINATKLCADGKRDFRTFKRGDRWKKIKEFWQKEACANLHMPVYELRKNYDKAQGQYIHPDLIHFLADWISIEYAFKVAKIMNLINVKNQLANQTLEDTILDLQDQLDEARTTIEMKDKIIQQQDKHIDKTSVPLQNSDKYLYILRNEQRVEGSKYGSGAPRGFASANFIDFHLSADSTKPPPEELVVYKFVFSASMNYKQHIKSIGNTPPEPSWENGYNKNWKCLFKNYYHFDGHNLKQVLTIIRDLKPQSEYLNHENNHTSVRIIN